MAKVTLPGSWPPAANIASGTSRSWLRYERQYPGSDRPSRLISHPSAPYVAQAQIGGSDGDIDLTALGNVAEHYLQQLETYVNAKTPPPLGESDPMLELLASVSSTGSLLDWCDIWPEIDAPPKRLQGQMASWNMSRNPKSAMPGTVILVATETIPNPLGSSAPMRLPSAGFRVPIEVRETASGFDLIIRGLTAEFPGGGYDTLSSILAGSTDDERLNVLSGLARSLSGVPLGYQSGDSGVGIEQEPVPEVDDFPMSSGADDYTKSETAKPKTAKSTKSRIVSILEENIAKRAGVEVNSLLLQDVQFSADQENAADGAWNMTLTLLARGEETPRSASLSYRLTVRVRLKDLTQNRVELVSVTRVPLVSHGDGPGGAVIEPVVRVFPAPPLDWRAAAGQVPPQPSPPLAWRRPARSDSLLDLFRENVTIPLDPDRKMKQAAYVVRNCPRIVRGDGDGKLPKELPPIDVSAVPPRRDLSSAINAYWHCKTFFDSMRGLGLPPETYVATSDGPLSVHYRSGITPGPGGSGRTINAQVRYEVASDAVVQSKPSIDMHLALANLNRWARVKPGTADSRLEPLSIATCGRWMMHEFGHYLLAARIGQLEFDFAHSPGDALAAVFFDPLSELSNPSYAGDPRMRGWTFPYIFAPRRHDRTPAMGWGWYGLLNRSVIEDPPKPGTDHKAYLTEQILSSSIFLLYRALGGDTLDGAQANWELRGRASDMTLYLLMQGIAGLAQSPSRAEMLEIAMEAAGWGAPAAVPLLRGGLDWQPASSHKVIRWAFEAMGMFPEDATKITSKAGAAPLVDIYIRDGRPDIFPTGDGATDVGPGSYVPVSLHWAANADWVMDSALPEIGNRGSVAANGARLRVWVGWVLNDKPISQIMERSVVWLGQMLNLGPYVINPDVAAAASISNSDQQQITQLAADGQGAAPAGVQMVVLYEVSDVGDRANTDPAAALPLAIGAGDTPPETVQTLVDLVANDNNLALKVQG
ncbi:hypothetical protein [Phaeobacter sp. C3_T13_0]|uniref:hypothetical protein n=1 Tax=Phaeobacter cretensis TaxID=3342641 RepID=UPI0039BC5F25